FNQRFSSNAIGTGTRPTSDGRLRELRCGTCTGCAPAPQVASLMRMLAPVPDPRARRGVRRRLVAVLVMSVCACYLACAGRLAGRGRAARAPLEIRHTYA